MRLSAFALLLFAAQLPLQSSAGDSLVKMTASDETFTFEPNEIDARAGQQTTLELTSNGGVHGIASSELGIEKTLIRTGRPAIVNFTPSTPGRFVVHCANVCGVGHKGMAFTVNVEL